MKLLLKHGMKLTVANLLGLLVYFFLASLLHVGYYVLIFVSVLGTVGGMKLFTDISLDGDQIDGLVGSIVFVPVILFSLLYVLLSLVLQSMLIGGLYGSALESVFEDRSSISTYFKYLFRNFWRLTGLQLAILLLGLPIILCLVLGSALFVSVFGEDLLVLPISLSIIVGVLFITLFLHTPIFIIQLKEKIWRAIGLSFQLLKENPLRILLSGVIFFGTILIINGLFLVVVGLPALLGYLLLSEVVSLDVLEILSIIYTIMMGLIWGMIIVPFSGVCSILQTIDHYRKYFHPIVESKNEQYVYRYKHVPNE